MGFIKALYGIDEKVDASYEVADGKPESDRHRFVYSLELQSVIETKMLEY